MNETPRINWDNTNPQEKPLTDKSVAALRSELARYISYNLGDDDYADKLRAELIRRGQEL